MLICMLNSCNADRPCYSYSDDVFKELPVFPDDFYIIKELVDTQQIMPYRLNNSYYLQPEILPSWGFCSETYYNKTSDSIGCYGLGFYPSRFDIYTPTLNTTISLGSIMFCNPGINLFQGASLKVVAPDFINISLSQQNVLLGFTYPYFHRNWSTIIKYDIEINKTESGVIEIFEQPLDKFNDTYYKNLYNKNYVSGNSLLSMKTPRVKIFIHNDKIIENKDAYYTFSYPPIIYVIIFLVSIYIIYKGGKYAVQRYEEKKI